MNGPTAPPTVRPQPSAPVGAGEAPRSKRRWAILGAVGVALAIAAASAIVVGMRGRDNTATASAAGVGRVAPEAIEAKFQVDAPTMSGGFGHLTALVDDRERIVQYDESGEERWSFEVPEEWSSTFVGSEVGGKIPVQISDSTRDPEDYVGFLDADTGKMTDTEIDVDSDEGQIAVSSSAGWLNLWGDHSLELYDPETGELHAEVRADVVESARWADVIVAVNDYTVSFYDLDLQPIVTDFAVDDEHSRFLFDAGGFPDLDVVDGKVITVDGSLIVGSDDNGVAWTIDPGMGQLIDARSFGDDAWMLTLATGDVAIAQHTDGDEFNEVWRGSNLGFPERIGDDGVLFSGYGLVFVSSEGDELYSVDHIDPADHITIDNGFLIGRDVGENTEVTFVDVDGVERWNFETDYQVLGVKVLDNAVFDPESGTVYGPE